MRDRGLAFTTLAFEEVPPAMVGVVLTSWRDAVQGGLPATVPVVAVPVGPDAKEDVEAGIQSALRVLEGKVRYGELVVGLDPGSRPGVAVLADGQLVHTVHAASVYEAVRVVEASVRHVPADRVVVRVGDGSPAQRDEILAAVARGPAGSARLELVDERGTTPVASSGPWSRDVTAAIGIARSEGRLHEPRVRRPTRGELRNLQRLSRELAQGRFSISARAARRVAMGRESLEEAVARESRRFRRKK